MEEKATRPNTIMAGLGYSSEIILLYGILSGKFGIALCIDRQGDRRMGNHLFSRKYPRDHFLYPGISLLAS